jgi:hypothetical protein
VINESMTEQLELVEVSNFFANAFTYLVPSEMDCRAAVADLAEAACNIALGGDASSATSILQTLCKCVIERREYVQRAVLDIMQNQFLATKEGPRFAFCAMMLSGEDYTSPFRRQPLLDLPPRISDDARERLKAELRRRAFVDAFAAYLYTEWYRDAFSELFEIHGMAMLIDDRRPWPGNREAPTPSLLVGLVLATFGYFQPEAASWSPQAWSIGCLELVGRTVDASAWPGNLSVKTRVSLPPSIWSRAIARTRLNLYALRGLLLICRWFDGSIFRASLTSNRKARGDSPGPFAVDSIPSLREQISKILEKLKPSETELFEFWSKDVSVAERGNIVGDPAD